ncbi:hypothetical protein Dxin01_02397 [Deinococcus xinjiangensis]|uniref:Uncharacterized protein n=1 Tax=Deinococcus xinjiangensis TaxID=457454 RepID=A0ABP9VF14_9DEIO
MRRGASQTVKPSNRQTAKSIGLLNFLAVRPLDGLTFTRADLGGAP